MLQLLRNHSTVVVPIGQCNAIQCNADADANAADCQVVSCLSDRLGTTSPSIGMHMLLITVQSMMQVGAVGNRRTSFAHATESETGSAAVVHLIALNALTTACAVQ